MAIAPAVDRKMWLVGGAIFMGTSIWSMHFMAMLTFSLPVAIKYNLLLTAVSLVVAILASGLALSFVSRSKVGLSTLLTAAVILCTTLLLVANAADKADAQTFLQ